MTDSLCSVRDSARLLASCGRRQADVCQGWPRQNPSHCQNCLSRCQMDCYYGHFHFAQILTLSDPGERWAHRQVFKLYSTSADWHALFHPFSLGFALKSRLACGQSECQGFLQSRLAQSDASWYSQGPSAPYQSNQFEGC